MNLPLHYHRLGRLYGPGMASPGAGQVESEARRAHSPRIDALLIDAVRWVGGDVPIETPCCPRSGEVRLFFAPARATRVSSLFGSRLQAAIEDDHVVIELDRLDLYDSLIVEY